ncbi:hypothetical protein [Allostreptomyces psammosilenae]|uniref:Plant heme peroxidase family profile domain-containing protein n=1 Tax=Allostreptomyces psammosilenae TaxID=1892865 RepID=A0A852ZT52_9ACTN|nr:hypothetical protein [Allostreptomyces psammosilenae]NYI04707.1 hypothetical protein [Allostreptomyces psammosilenae]
MTDSDAIDRWVRHAARNNAEWCDAVCRAHGRPGRFGATAWTNARRTPPLYPDAVTLDPAATASEVLAGVDVTSPGCSVKDSFGRLDLTAAGFEVLFEARWIVRDGHDPATPAADGTPAADVRWAPVRDAADLDAWQSAWAGGSGAGGPFRAELLERDDVVVLGGRRDGRIVAGAVANLSGDGAVVGVSNVFGDALGLDAAWSGVVAAVSRHFPGVAMVGYERGGDLRAALRHGWRAVGPLRVWLRDTPADGTVTDVMRDS